MTAISTRLIFAPPTNQPEFVPHQDHGEREFKDGSLDRAFDIKSLIGNMTTLNASTDPDVFSVTAKGE
jgi:hypothetical protein